MEKTTDEYDYGIVLDAGSSGTRAYVYKWLKNRHARKGGSDQLKALPELETKDKWTKKVHPGVSTFGENPEDVGPDHLKDLIKHALKYVPEQSVPQTPIFLLATAGMRLLPEHQRDALLKNICSYLKAETKLLISDCDLHIQVISGETEGLYGWIAANYLLGGFNAPEQNDHGKGHHTYGFLDMGGASAQIAFAPNATEARKHADDLKLVRLRTVDGNIQEHRVFVSTWLGFGVNEARKRYVKALLEAFDTTTSLEYPDPCLPSGLLMTTDAEVITASDASSSTKHLVGTGKFDECLKRTFPLLEKEKSCLDEPCLINGQHIPAIDFDVNHFIGISEYWHTTHEIFEMAHKDKSYDFHTYQARVKEFCEQPWSKTQSDVANHMYGKKVNEQTAYEVCFKASWIINMLHDGIGVPRVGLEGIAGTHNGTKEVIESSQSKGYIDPFQAVNKIKSTEVSWTMGKMALYASADVPPAPGMDPDLYPVGFGSNQEGIAIPMDFQYPGGGLLQKIPSSTDPNLGTQPAETQSIGDKLSSPFAKSDSSHRIPGFIFFLLIIIIAIFYLCGRERRTRFFHRYLPHTLSRTSHSPRFSSKRYDASASSKISSLVQRFLPGTRSSSEYDRSLEDGTSHRLYNPADFELGDIDSSDDDNNPSITTSMSDLAVNASKGNIVGAYGSPPIKRSTTPRPPLRSSQSALTMTDRLQPDIMDRRGLALRTESSERLDLAGRMGRNHSLSPTRVRS